MTCLIAMHLCVSEMSLVTYVIASRFCVSEIKVVTCVVATRLSVQWRSLMSRTCQKRNIPMKNHCSTSCGVILQHCCLLMASLHIH